MSGEEGGDGEALQAPYREWLRRRSNNLWDKTTRRRAGTSGSRTGTLAALPEHPEGIKLGCRFRKSRTPLAQAG